MMPERSVENHAHRLRIDQESAQAFWTDLGPISEALEIGSEQVRARGRNARALDGLF